jgi:large repetitive protein
MNRFLGRLCPLVAILIYAFSGSSIYSETIVIPYTDSGSYKNNGTHSPGNPNYVVGGDFGIVYRNFFVFDLAAVSKPITSAKLALSVLGDFRGEGYLSPDLSENYELHDVTTPIATLVNGTSAAAYGDLGGGIVYGSRTMTAADNGSVVEITLNSNAIAALDAANGLIGIGGSLTTLDQFANNTEVVFAISGNVPDVRELRLTLVPEPSTIAKFGVMLLFTSAYRRTKR